jgi:hypothetical protein
MSHVAKIDLVISDLDCLEKACAECGLILNRGQTNYRWYGSWQNDYSAEDAAYKHGIKPEDYGKCSHAISVPGNSSAYEVGVVKNPDGEGWVLIWDFYSGGHGLQQLLGGPKDANKLLTSYSKEVILAKADEMGFTYDWEKDENGEIEITITDYS